MGKETNSYRYDEGTLLIDIVEAKSGTLIWRGWGFSNLDDDNLSSRQQIRKTARKIFTGFPALKLDSF